MEDVIINKELVRRIFGNLGAVPGNNFGIVGITTQDHITEKLIKLENEDGTVEQYSTFAGEINTGDVSYKIILTNAGIIDEPDFFAILKADDAPAIGFSLVYTHDNEIITGNILIKHEDKWAAMGMLHKLNITAAIELITQEGRIWLPCKDCSAIHKLLVELVDMLSF